MPELTVDDVIQYTHERLSDDDETERLLTAAVAAARMYCGWHVTPVIEDDEVMVDGSGGMFLSLPTRQLLDVTSVLDNGVMYDTPYAQGIRWSTPKGLLYKSSGWWTCQFNAVIVTITHGYADAPAFNQAVLSMVDRSSLGAAAAGSRMRAGPFEIESTAASGSSGSDSAFTPIEKSLLEAYRILPAPS